MSFTYTHDLHCVCFYVRVLVCSETVFSRQCVFKACYSLQFYCIFYTVCFYNLIQFAVTLYFLCSVFFSLLQCAVTLYFTCSVFSQPVTALCSSEPSARPGRPVAGSLDSHRASLAAAARLSPVSLSIEAARRPSAFIAHLAHKRPDMYMTDLCTSTPSDESRRRPAAVMSAGGACCWRCFRIWIWQAIFMETKKHKGPNLIDKNVCFPCDSVTGDAGFNRWKTTWITSLWFNFGGKIWELKTSFHLPGGRGRLRLFLPPWCPSLPPTSLLSAALRFPLPSVGRR